MNPFEGVNISKKASDILKPIILESLDKPWIYQKQVISYLLYLTNQKPAAEFTETYQSENLENGSVPPPKRPIPKSMSELGIPHEVVLENLNSNISTVHYEAVSSPDVELPPVTLPDEETYHKMWGRHYGYPDSAIEGYISDNVLRYHESKEQFGKLLRLARVSGYDIEEAKRISLVSFIPANTVTGVKEGIEKGLSYEEKLEEIAEELQCSEISELVENVVEETPFGDYFG